MAHERKSARKVRPHLRAQVKLMVAVTYGPLVVASHAKCGYLTTPITFGDFPAVVGSPYFLGVVPAIQATPKAATKATATRGIKPHSSQGRVFSVNTISCVAVLRKKGQRQGRRGSKPHAVVSNSCKTVLVGDIRVWLDGGEPILPRDKSVPSVATSNKKPAKSNKEERANPPKTPRRQCLSEKKLRTPNLLVLADRKGGVSTGSPTLSPPKQSLLKEEARVSLKLPHQESQSLKG
ncbi:hypothetical protein Taro_045110 [Colocasia esculenta]|uniref:Uncharacterized protein n=1 Tax=Colocasia esculenta TaxID=4460 RepID=A0A843X3Q9_COLES|nr:hypothetical protein [Colocasia esculenta]